MKKIYIIIICIFSSIFVLCSSSFSLAAPNRDVTRQEAMAQTLKQLNLFKGVSSTNFDLKREPTRLEAIVMLVRVLGKEQEALSAEWKHPFTDVPIWATRYVGYAYVNGLTNGVSPTKYGTGIANASTYLTFVLRALGYSDVNNADFSWSNPYSLAGEIGILTREINTVDFWRADVVSVSYNALAIPLKGSSKTLAQKLIDANVFTEADFSKYYGNSSPKVETNKALTAKDIYAQCSPAVFYIEVYDAKGTTISSGSGFFIDSQGIAVTNYHVIDGCYTAKITTSDTNKTYDVLGVYDYNKDQDWAILKVDGSNFSYLPLNDSSSISGGETVYAIGSPLGLQNTISQGLISNSNRTEDNMSYIQTTASISSGSSGGALINEYGYVIGITSASYMDGQNLNLAIPISYIKNFSQTTTKTLTAIATGNMNTKIKAYTAYPDVLDCGAFYGIEPFANTSTTYYYDLTSISSNSFDKGFGCEDYRGALEDFGCVFIGDYLDAPTVGWIYSLSTTSTDYNILVGYTTHQGTKSMFVQIESNSHKAVKTYTKSSHIPDFGDYFGVGLLGTNDIEIGGTILSTNYTYATMSLLQTAYYESFFELYIDLLFDYGFVLEKNELNSEGIMIYTFTHPDHEGNISYSLTEDFVFVNVFYFNI